MEGIALFIEGLQVATGLQDVQFNKYDEIELIFDEKIYVKIVHLGNNEFEFSSALDNYDIIDETIMKQLLQANHLGNATGAARLAIHPRDRGVVLCERFSAQHFDADELKVRMNTFVRTAAFWLEPRSSFSPDVAATLSDEELATSLVFRP